MHKVAIKEKCTDNFCQYVTETLSGTRKRKKTIKPIAKLFALHANAKRKAVAKLFALHANLISVKAILKLLRGKETTPLITLC